jgi:hypothetical protein
MMETLRALGIEKGKDFRPDAATQIVLRAAAQQAPAWFMDRLVTAGWPDHKWDIPVPPIGVKSGFTWEADGVLDLDARGKSRSIASSLRRRSWVRVKVILSPLLMQKGDGCMAKTLIDSTYPEM